MRVSATGPQSTVHSTVDGPERMHGSTRTPCHARKAWHGKKNKIIYFPHHMYDDICHMVRKINYFIFFYHAMASLHDVSNDGVLVSLTSPMMRRLVSNVPTSHSWE